RYSMLKNGRQVRTMRIGLCLVISAVLLASCGFFTGSSESDEKTLVFGGFGGSLETSVKEEVIPAFEEKFDAKVTYVTGTSDELLAKARDSSSGVDLIWTNDTTHFQGKAEGLFAKL